VKSRDSVVEVLDDEFASYYHGDELPSAERFAGQIEDRATATASRLRASFGPDDAVVAANLLRAAAFDRTHPLVASVSFDTETPWASDDADWANLQQLFRRIADQLTADG
jgi:hypothetical protein